MNIKQQTSCWVLRSLWGQHAKQGTEVICSWWPVLLSRWAAELCIWWLCFLYVSVWLHSQIWSCWYLLKLDGMGHKHQPNYKPHPGMVRVLPWRSTPLGLCRNLFSAPQGMLMILSAYYFAHTFNTQDWPQLLMHVWLASWILHFWAAETCNLFLMLLLNVVFCSSMSSDLLSSSFINYSVSCKKNYLHSEDILKGLFFAEVVCNCKSWKTFWYWKQNVLSYLLENHQAQRHSYRLYSYEKRN